MFSLIAGFVLLRPPVVALGQLRPPESQGWDRRDIGQVRPFGPDGRFAKCRVRPPSARAPQRWGERPFWHGSRWTHPAGDSTAHVDEIERKRRGRRSTELRPGLPIDKAHEQATLQAGGEVQGLDKKCPILNAYVIHPVIPISFPIEHYQVLVSVRKQ